MDLTEQYDVIVLGGGTAGVIAAVQAGRIGARTLLVEKAAALGGTTTIGGVNFPGLFHAWGQQVIAGIGWDLVRSCVEESGGTLPDFTHYQQPHHRLQIRVNPHVYSALCNEAVVQSGADMLLHTMVADLREEGSDGWQVDLCAKEGIIRCSSRVVIDATGDANATSIAGLPLQHPEEKQPATLTYRVGGYDPAKLDMARLNSAFDAEVKAGRLSYTDASWNTTGANLGRWLHSRGVQSNHIHHIDARDSAGKTRLELQARKSLLSLYRFLRRQPGLEDLTIEYIAPECGVRETATIRGEATVTVHDYQSGRLWEDAVCYSFYPIDLHVSSGSGLDMEMLTEGIVPTIPRAAMIPKGSRNFLVAGRCISSDRLANSALRVQATSMGTGQGAGALAALAASEGCTPGDVPLDAMRSLLKAHGAVVPPSP
ncbi:MAG: FAD-dependent oxidoreductase [Candidatus Latescibacterota bacterium]|nr:FAD-dependent oxidoreductase [Candidatus Latescibacterota bacterium]